MCPIEGRQLTHADAGLAHAFTHLLVSARGALRLDCLHPATRNGLHFETTSMNNTKCRCRGLGMVKVCSCWTQGDRTKSWKHMDLLLTSFGSLQLPNSLGTSVYAKLLQTSPTSNFCALASYNNTRYAPAPPVSSWLQAHKRPAEVAGGSQVGVWTVRGPSDLRRESAGGRDLLLAPPSARCARRMSSIPGCSADPLSEARLTSWRLASLLLSTIAFLARSSKGRRI